MRPASSTTSMTQLRVTRSLVRFLHRAVTALLIACGTAGFSVAQTAMEVANQRRAQLTQNYVAATSNIPNTSNLRAISASVDAEVDLRTNLDRQRDLVDPSLMPVRVMALNKNGEDDPSAQQPATQAASDDRTKYPRFVSFPLLTTKRNLRTMAEGKNQSELGDQFPGDSPRRRNLAIHRSVPAARPGKEPTAIHGLHKAQCQQGVYLGDCNGQHPSGAECSARFRHQRVSPNHNDPTLAYRKSLDAIR
jgi:hypothetical protein